MSDNDIVESIAECVHLAKNLTDPAYKSLAFACTELQHRLAAMKKFIQMKVCISMLMEMEEGLYEESVLPEKAREVRSILMEIEV